MTKSKHDLIGLWLLMPNPDFQGYYLTGKITRSIGEYHLVEIRPPENSQPTFGRLRSTADLCANDVTFFNSEAELEN